ncbi:MAG TPA: MATE family efflux transporter [Paracoccaceae bacterium]|nr:MATE family efflux transporter [Paracoccaceae bacterium]
MYPSDLAPADARLPARLLRHAVELYRLAWPVMLSRAGILTLSLADIIMVGQYDTASLAHIAMGYAVFVPIMVTGIGTLTGIVAVTARHVGAGDWTEAAATFRRGLAWTAGIALLSTGLIWFAETWLHLIGQGPDLAAGGGLIARWLAPGAALQVLFIGVCFYLEGTKRMLPGLVLMAIANLVNVVGNWLLIGGELGLPEMGAEGAALASVLARLVMAAGILWYALRLPEIRRLPTSGIWGPGGWRAAREIRVIGLASGVAYFFEVMSFAWLNQVAGLISPVALAAYSIAHQVEATIFMVALGLAVATAVRVGQARGARRMAEARFAGWFGLAATMGTVALLSGLVVSGASSLGTLFSSDPAMVARTAPLFVVLAISLVFDGGQVVVGQANRALGDSWPTTFCLFLAFWGVMLPLGTWLGLETPLAEAGLFIATACGCAVAVGLLALRFSQLVRRAEMER